MFKNIYNILQRCDEEKAAVLAKGRHLKVLRTAAEVVKAHPFTIKALDFELEDVRAELAFIDSVKKSTPVSRAVVVEVDGGQC